LRSAPHLNAKSLDTPLDATVPNSVLGVGYEPSIFVSYAHEDAALATALAEALKSCGARVWLDQGELLIGDSLIQRISDAIAEFDFVAALVSDASVQSNWCQKELALAMSKQLRRGTGRVTVLPLRVGDVTMPTSLVDVKWVQLDADNLGAAARVVVDHAGRHLETAENRATPKSAGGRDRRPISSARGATVADDVPVTIVGVDIAGVTKPRLDGTRGSGLYRVPLQLNRVPPKFWSDNFGHTWDHPPVFTTMHRPGIGSIHGDRIVLDGTTIEEVEQYHVTTLKLVVRRLNEMTDTHLAAERQRREAEQIAAAEHERQVADIASRLRFDDE
jgi:hypothetical protein